jgi:probable addiction module antidote protein
MKLKTTVFDGAKYLTDPEDQADLLNDALQSGNAGYIADALGLIARARGMSRVARGSEVTREALYKSLTRSGDPKLTTVMGVLSTLGIELSCRSKVAKAAGKAPRAKSKRAA